MSRKIALLFSGQGAQSVGMGKDLAEAYPVAAELFTKADAALDRSLTGIMFEGPEDELTRTMNCQPALYLHGLAALAALREEVGDIEIVATAGLSLGEFTAHTAAETWTFETGLRLVEQRGSFMEDACQSTNGSMAAMIGKDESTVRELASETDVDVANLNAPGQIVLSGEAAKISLAVSLAGEKGIRRATELKVAGAYHSRLMESAYQKLIPELDAADVNAPKVPVICNVDGIPAIEPAKIRGALADQVTGTVRWTQCMDYMLDELDCDLFIELGPGGILAGLMKRNRKGIEVLSVANVEQVKAAAEVLNAL